MNLHTKQEAQNSAVKGLVRRENNPTIRKLGIEGNFLTLLEDMHEKPPANIPLNVFSLRSDIRKGCLFLPLLFDIIVEVLTSETSQEIKGGDGGSSKIMELRVLGDLALIHTPTPTPPETLI